MAGGASSLLAAPAASNPLAELRTTKQRLLERGLTSMISTPHATPLGEQGRPTGVDGDLATVVGLAFSAVVGNDPSVIRSGPTVPDGSTYGDALAVFDRADL